MKLLYEIRSDLEEVTCHNALGITVGPFIYY